MLGGQKSTRSERTRVHLYAVRHGYCEVIFYLEDALNGLAQSIVIKL